MQARLGDVRKADSRLSDYLAARPRTADGEWASHVGTFLIGRDSEEAFFQQAASGDAKTVGGQRCEAWFYAGIKKLVVGDKASAGDHFRKCLATGERYFTEYIM